MLGNRPRDPRVLGNISRDSRVLGNTPGDPRVLGNTSGDSRMLGNRPGDPRVLGNRPRDPRVPGNRPGDPRVLGNTPGEPRVLGDTPRDPRVLGNTPGDPRVLGNTPGDPRVLGNTPGNPGVLGNTPRDPISARTSIILEMCTEIDPRPGQPFATFGKSKTVTVVCCDGKCDKNVLQQLSGRSFRVCRKGKEIHLIVSSSYHEKLLNINYYLSDSVTQIQFLLGCSTRKLIFNDWRQKCLIFHGNLRLSLRQFLKCNNVRST